MTEAGREYLIKIQKLVAERNRLTEEVEALVEVDSLAMFGKPEWAVGSIIEDNPMSVHRGKKILVEGICLREWKSYGYVARISFRLMRKDGTEGKDVYTHSYTYHEDKVHD